MSVINITVRWLAIILFCMMGAWVFPAHALTQVRTSSFEYDSSGLLVKEVIEPNSPNDCLQTSYSYDSFGNKNSVSTSACASATGSTIASAATARTASSNYGTDGRFPITSKNALSQSETKAFDARFGTATSLTGPNSLTTTWAYDSFGRKTRETRTDGTYTTWAYKFCSESGMDCPKYVGGAITQWGVIEQSYANNGTPSAPEKRQYYDQLNRIVRVQTQGFDGGGVAAPTLLQDTEYNALGQVSRQSNVYASTGTPVWSSNFYDQLGRVVRQETPDPDAANGIAITTMAYNGLITTATNAKGQTKTTQKNAQGFVAVVTDVLGSTVTYTYDALGQLLQTNAAGSITTLSYNQRGQKTAMQDPAMGSWVYSYNAFGELVSQRDSLNQTSTMAYDVLGRLLQRTESDLNSQWSYDTRFDGTACGKSVGKLCEAKSDNGYNRKHSYDSLGRASSTATVLDNATTPATVSVNYDANTGRVASKTWPTGYQASYSYTALGYLKKVTGGGTNGFTQTVSYEVLAMDNQGHITQYKQGNQVTTVATYDSVTGRLKGQAATKDGQTNGNVLNQSYTYDTLGNLTSRIDNTAGVGTQENYSYDSLNRLTLATMVGGSVSPPTTTQVMYDVRGNISYKSDVGTYVYDAARPNRMIQVRLEAAPGSTFPLSGTRNLWYVFDDFRSNAQSVNGTILGNGNLERTISYDAPHGIFTLRNESYTSFNMPGVITYGNIANNPSNDGTTAKAVTTSTADRTLSFIYGPEHQRIKQNVLLTGNGTSSYFAGNTWYLNGEDGQGLSYEKEIRTNGTTENKHYVTAGGVTFALFVSRTGTLNGLPATTTSYFQHDQLGSIAAITDDSGAVVERLAYDPWGKRRYIMSQPGQPDVTDALVGQKADRGYTEHEHLDEIGVVHMNGRIYDPLIGRFMSADPFIQAPGNLQSYNRYAYVMNNPLLYTDPSGYSWWTKVRGVVVRAVAAVADVYGCSGYCSAAVGGYYGSQNGGGLQGAIVGGVAGYVGYQVSVYYPLVNNVTGSILWSNVATAATINAGVGCVSAATSGGDCGRGALSGAVGTVGAAYGFMGSVVAGCAAGRATGGSCSQGALDAVQSAAINYLVGQAVASIRSSPSAGANNDFQGVKVACLEDACVVEAIAVSMAARALATTGAAISVGAYWSKFSAWVGDVYDNLTHADSADDTKPPLSDYKDALGKVHDEVGKLPRGEDGKFGSPQAGDSKKGYRLDPPHDGVAQGGAESKHHFNWWDYTGGKRGNGGRSGAIPIGD